MRGLCSPDPHLGPGVLCGGPGGGLQQTQEPLPQPDARRRRHPDRPLPAAQDRHDGEWDGRTGRTGGRGNGWQRRLLL